MPIIPGGRRRSGPCRSGTTNAERAATCSRGLRSGESLSCMNLHKDVLETQVLDFDIGIQPPRQRVLRGSDPVTDNNGGTPSVRTARKGVGDAKRLRESVSGADIQ